MPNETTIDLAKLKKALDIPMPKMPPFNIPKFELPKLPDSVTNPAKWAYTRLSEYIRKFESHLDEEHEIGARLVSFNENNVFHIIDMGYYGPDMITFYGMNDNGERVQLIQHHSQLNVLLKAVKKLGEKPIRIGFNLRQEAENDEDVVNK